MDDEEDPTEADWRIEKDDVDDWENIQFAVFSNKSQHWKPGGKKIRRPIIKDAPKDWCVKSEAALKMLKAKYDSGFTNDEEWKRKYRFMHPSDYWREDISLVAQRGVFQYCGCASRKCRLNAADSWHHCVHCSRRCVVFSSVFI